jgi:hypothetical protein
MHQIDFTAGQYLVILALLLLWLASLSIQIYGMYTCFVKKWYLGAVALLVPGFAFVVGLFKLFKRDILA